MTSHTSDDTTDTDTTNSDAIAAAFAVEATDLALSGNEGPVYGPLTFTVPATGLTVLVGRSGSGRTALALTLAGRMKPGSGTLVVCGEESLTTIRCNVAIAGVEQIDVLDRDSHIKDIISEHRAWSQPWWQLRKKADEAYFHTLASPVFGQRDLPPLDAYVSQLRSVDKHLLRMALALHPANSNPVKMLVVDDIEQIHELKDRQFFMERLLHIAEEFPVIVTATNTIPGDLIPADRHIELDTEAGHFVPKNSGRRPAAKHAAAKHTAAKHAAAKHAAPAKDSTNDSTEGQL